MAVGSIITFGFSGSGLQPSLGFQSAVEADVERWILTTIEMEGWEYVDIEEDE